MTLHQAEQRAQHSTVPWRRLTTTTTIHDISFGAAVAPYLACTICGLACYRAEEADNCPGIGSSMVLSPAYQHVQTSEKIFTNTLLTLQQCPALLLCLWVRLYVVQKKEGKLSWCRELSGVLTCISTSGDVRKKSTNTLLDLQQSRTVLVLPVGLACCGAERSGQLPWYIQLNGVLAYWLNSEDVLWPDTSSG